MSQPEYIPQTAITRQIANGVVLVNLATQTLESCESLFIKLKKGAKGIHVLKLFGQARGQRVGLVKQVEGMPSDPYGHDSHRAAVDYASWLAQHASQRKKIQSVLIDILSHAPITDLHIGMRLSNSGYAAISSGMKHSKTLQRLSFSGSKMGDAKLASLFTGLCSCNSLQELDLTSCDLGPNALHTCNAVIKDHMQRRVRLMFAATLRIHMDNSLPPPLARQLYDTELRNAQHAVDFSCGGLHVLHLAYNPKITDTAALSLRDALSMEGSLQVLDLQGCGLSLAVEREFVELIKEHTSLVKVDLRHGTGRKGHKLGLIRLKAAPNTSHQALTRSSTIASPSADRLNQYPSNAAYQLPPGRHPSSQDLSQSMPTGALKRLEPASAQLDGSHSWSQCGQDPGQSKYRGKKHEVVAAVQEEEPVANGSQQGQQQGGQQHLRERVRVLLKVVPDSSPQAVQASEAYEGGSLELHGEGDGIQGEVAAPGDAAARDLREAAEHVMQPMLVHKQTQAGGGELAANRGRRLNAGRQRRKKKKGGKRLAVNRGTSLKGPALSSAHRWGSLWLEQPMGCQKGASDKTARGSGRQHEEGILMELVGLLRRLDLTVSTKEYELALQAHPGALDDSQPKLRFQQEFGSGSNGSSSRIGMTMLQQQQQQQHAEQGTRLVNESWQGPRNVGTQGSYAPAAACKAILPASLLALKSTWSGADHMLQQGCLQGGATAAAAAAAVTNMVGSACKQGEPHSTQLEARCWLPPPASPDTAVLQGRLKHLAAICDLFAPSEHHHAN